MTKECVKFLLVDDTDENLVALEALLRREGLELLKAHSAGEALELLLVHDVALAMLDVQMPGMDGFELAELMRGMERTRHVPIIFLTAGARDPQRVFQGYDAGAVDFLFKPIDPHMLRSKADVFFQLHQQKIQIAQNLRMNELFVGILGHDLRNPLGSILAGAQLLERQLTDDKQLRTVRRMVSSAGRMRDMIDQLFELTRARLGGGIGLGDARQRLDVAALVSRAAEELQAAAPERQLAVTLSGDCTSAGDPTRLMQLISNLISNALRHGAPGTPVRVSAEGGPEIRVVVHNGGAIPREILPRIFDPFHGARVSAGSQGLGLGLFISQQIASAHGGSIGVQSTAEAGTTFTVRLPRLNPSPVTEAETDAPRILIVDDDDDIRDALRGALEEAGYATAVAANGHEALNMLMNGSPRPDAVVLDLVMPVLDGTRVYRAMQADTTLAAIPVIVSTSMPSLAPPGARVMAKPLVLSEMLDALAELCRR